MTQNSHFPVKTSSAVLWLADPMHPRDVCDGVVTRRKKQTPLKPKDTGFIRYNTACGESPGRGKGKETEMRK